MNGLQTVTSPTCVTAKGDWLLGVSEYHSHVVDQLERFVGSVSDQAQLARKPPTLTESIERFLGASLGQFRLVEMRENEHEQEMVELSRDLDRVTGLLLGAFAARHERSIASVDAAP
jgi:hypothetical protein